MIGFEADLATYQKYLGVGILVSLILAWRTQSRAVGSIKAIWLSLTEVILGGALGLLFSKIIFILIRIGYQTINYTSLNPEELSFFGAVGGVILAVVISAWIYKQSCQKILNAIAPAGAFLIAFARLAECVLGEFGVAEPSKIGLPVDDVLYFPWGIGIDFVGDGSYPEFLLPVFLFEMVIAIIAGILALIWKNDRDCFIRTLFYICLAQVILESTRKTSLTWLFPFLRAEQLMCFLYVEGVLVLYAVRRCKEKKWYGLISPILGLLVAGIVILIEFGLQDKVEFLLEMNHEHKEQLYIIMGASLAVLGIADIVHHVIGYRSAKQAVIR